MMVRRKRLTDAQRRAMFAKINNQYQGYIIQLKPLKRRLVRVRTEADKEDWRDMDGPDMMNKINLEISSTKNNLKYGPLAIEKKKEIYDEILSGQYRRLRKMKTEQNKKVKSINEDVKEFEEEFE